MTRLVIDGRACEAAPGATILDAARAAGVDVPTLCWYPQLPTVGNCRICLVSVEGTGKLLPACATPAAEGMVVHTESQAVATSSWNARIARARPYRISLQRVAGFRHCVRGGGRRF